MLKCSFRLHPQLTVLPWRKSILLDIKILPQSHLHLHWMRLFSSLSGSSSITVNHPKRYPVKSICFLVFIFLGWHPQSVILSSLNFLPETVIIFPQIHLQSHYASLEAFRIFDSLITVKFPNYCPSKFIFVPIKSIFHLFSSVS